MPAAPAGSPGRCRLGLEVDEATVSEQGDDYSAEHPHPHGEGARSIPGHIVVRAQEEP
jgi:hypothetical protein